MKQSTKKGWLYALLALLSLAGIGLEIILVLVIEPLMYGTQMEYWNTAQHITNWILICIAWGATAFAVIKISKNKCGFDIFENKERPKAINLVVIAVLGVLSLVLSYIQWNGFLFIQEFINNGLLKFIFQYIYYIFETLLVMLIIIFMQKAGESWFKNSNIPYGGIAAAVTWGLGHILTKGSLTIAASCVVSGFLFGSVYLLAKRNVKLTYLIMFIMFIL